LEDLKMALTLLEAAKLAAGRDEVYVATVMELFAKSSELLQVLPFDTIIGNTYKYNREKILPGVAFRGVNEAYTESTGQVGVEQVTLKIAGGDLDVDSYFVRTTGPAARDNSVALKIKALALYIGKQIIKGNSDTDPKSFDGLQSQITNTTLCIVANGATASGDALSLVKLDALCDYCEEPTHLIMPKTLKRYLSAAARLTTVGGYITYELNAFGQRVAYYNGLPIVGVDKDETNAVIMDFTEACASGSSVGTSIYAISTGPTGVKMLQSAPMRVQDLGEMQSKPVFRTRVEWDICLAVERELSAARLRYIKDAAVVA
jgi:hypothetical protein